MGRAGSVASGPRPVAGSSTTSTPERNATATACVRSREESLRRMLFTWVRTVSTET